MQTNCLIIFDDSMSVVIQSTVEIRINNLKVPYWGNISTSTSEIC